MQQAMLRSIEAADARTALGHSTVIPVPRQPVVMPAGGLGNVAALAGTILAVVSR